MKTAQHSELTGVGHRIGEGALEKELFCDADQMIATLKFPTQILEHLMKCFYVGNKIDGPRAWVLAADEKGTGVSENTSHVADQFVRSTNSVSRVEICEAVRSAAQGLLSSVGESRQEVA